DVHVRAVVLRWRGERLHEPVLLQLPGSRAPPQGARLSALATVRPPPAYERTWLRRHGVHVVLRASRWRIVRVRGGVADRLHAWLARASTPGLAGERRAVLAGVVLGEDGGLSETLRQRFRASGLYHLLAVSGGNVLVVAGGTVTVAVLAGVSRLVAEVFALAAIAAYVLAVGPQPSVIRAGIAGGLLSLAWLTGRPGGRRYALLAAMLPPFGPLLAQAAGWCAAYLAGCARFFGGLPGAQARSPAAVAALGAGVLLAAAYAWRRGERAEAGLPPTRERRAQDRARGSPLA